MRQAPRNNSPPPEKPWIALKKHGVRAARVSSISIQGNVHRPRSGNWAGCKVREYEAPRSIGAARSELVLNRLRGMLRPFLEQAYGFGKVRVEFQYTLDLLARLCLPAFLPQNLGQI